jgi:integrase
VAPSTLRPSRTRSGGGPTNECARQRERRAVAHFGAGRYLDTLGVADVQGWLNALAAGQLTDGAPLGPGNVRHHLNALSNLYRRAGAEEVVPPGYNPPGAILEKPTGSGRRESPYLEVPDAALLLEAARTLRPSGDGGPRGSFAYGYPLLATFLLTGGREAEVLGLEVGDVSFDRGVVTFRPNEWRRLKTRRSHRTVPLWPQLAEILQPYVDQRVVERGGRLLFPRFTASGAEAMITDFRKLLDRVAQRAGWAVGEIRSKRFRHTYCAARLQTLDGDAPVGPYTVARELGHSSVAMVEAVYSHLGAQRHRSAVVEYRVEQHAAKLGDRLTAVREGETLPRTLPDPATPAG